MPKETYGQYSRTLECGHTNIISGKSVAVEIYETTPEGESPEYNTATTCETCHFDHMRIVRITPVVHTVKGW